MREGVSSLGSGGHGEPKKKKKRVRRWFTRSASVKHKSPIVEGKVAKEMAP